MQQAELGRGKKRYLVQEASKRLLRDLNELRSSDSIYNVNAAPLEQDMFVWHFNLKPSDNESKYFGMLIHGTIQFPADYPITPPKVHLSVPVEHPNIETDSEKNHVVCLGILEPVDGIHGWNSGYSVLSILVSLQSMFSAEYAGRKGTPSHGDLAREGRTIKALKEACKALQIEIQPGVKHTYREPWPPINDQKVRKQRSAQTKVPITNIAHEWNVAKGDKGVQYGRVLFEAKVEDVFSPTTAQHMPYRGGAYFVPQSTKNLTFCRVGWGTDKLTEDMSYGVFYGNGQNGHLFVGESETNHSCLPDWGQNFGKHDIITTAVDFDRRSIFFAKNGILQGQTPIPDSFHGKKLFPVVGLMSAHVELNFGKPTKPASQLSHFECIEDHTKITRSEHLWDNNPLSTNVKGWNHLPEAIADLSDRSPNSRHCRDPDGTLERAFKLLNGRDLQRCRQVCKLWKKIIDERSLRRRFALRCFHSRAHYTDERDGRGVIMGFGFAFNQDNLVQSKMQYITYESWRHSQVRRAPYGEELQYFFPLMLDPSHSRRAEDVLRESISKLSDSHGAYSPSLAVDEICSLMNRLILNIPFLIGQKGTNKEQLITSTIQFYCALHHAMLYLGAKEPQIRKEAERRVSKFLKDPSSRQMSKCMQLGKILQYLSLTHFTWNQLRKPYMTEAFDRDAGEYVKKHPEIEDVDTDPNPKADPIFLSKVFKSTSQSRELLMYQVFFLTKLCQPHGQQIEQVLSKYHQHLSGPPTDTYKMMEEYIEAIKGVSDWQKFFQILFISPPTDQFLTKIFRDSVMRAAQKGYFEPKILNPKEFVQPPKPSPQQRRPSPQNRNGPGGPGPRSGGRTSPRRNGNGPPHANGGRNGPPPKPVANRFPRNDNSGPHSRNSPGDRRGPGGPGPRNGPGGPGPRNGPGGPGPRNGPGGPGPRNGPGGPGPRNGPGGPGPQQNGNVTSGPPRGNWATKRSNIKRNEGAPPQQPPRRAPRVAKKNPPAKSFQDLPGQIQKALKDKFQITRARQFQVEALEALTKGQDSVIVQPLGSGRTILLGIAALHRIDPEIRRPQVVIIVPEKLQARHIGRTIMALASYMRNVKVVVCVGGHGPGTRTQHQDCMEVQQGAHIVIGTPGRLKGIIERNAFKIDSASAIFLMESDRLFDPGQSRGRRQNDNDSLGTVKEQVLNVMAQVPQGIQVVICSATMTETILDTTHKIVMNEKSINPPEGHINVGHYYVYVQRDQFRLEVLKEFIKQIPSALDKMVVFVNNPGTMGMLQRELEQLPDGMGKCRVLMGRTEQVERDRTVEDFARGSFRILLCTDKIPTYNLHKAKLRVAINYDLPMQPDAYLRRASLASTIRGVQCSIISFSTDQNEERFKAIEHVCDLPEGFKELPANLEELVK